MPTNQTVTDLQYWDMRRAGETAPGCRLADGSWQFTGPTSTPARSEVDILQQLALQRCPPVPVPADLLATLIRAALGEPVTAAETALLQQQLSQLATASTQITQLRSATTKTAIEAAGGKLWPI